MKRMASSDSAHSLVLDECDKLLAATQGRNILPSSEIMNHALDIAQAARASKSSTNVSFANSAEEFNNCDVTVITAGIPRKPGMSRDDLLLTNAKIMTSVINEIAPFNKDAIYIIVSNPLDAMVYTALKATSLPRNKSQVSPTGKRFCHWLFSSFLRAMTPAPPCCVCKRPATKSRSRKSGGRGA